MKLRKLMRSAGFRLMMAYALLFIVSVAGLYGTAYWIIRQALVSQLTESIDDELNELSDSFQRGGTVAVIDEIVQRIGTDPSQDEYYLFRDGSGNRLAGNLDIDALPTDWTELPPQIPKPVHASPEEWAEHRVLARSQPLPGGYSLVAGADLFRLVEAEEAVIRAFAIILSISLLVAVIGGAVLSRRVLKRLDDFNVTFNAIVRGELTRRIPVVAAGDEFDLLGGNINRMLDRLQTLMESVRQVSHDIAHDLRTPLTRLRQHLDQARRENLSQAQYESHLTQALKDTDDILRTFSALLRIAEIEAKTRQSGFAPVDLAALCRSVVDIFTPVAEDHHQVIAADIQAVPAIRGDKDLLVQMLVNLVENSLHHTPPGTRISISVRHDPATKQIILVVADNGPGIPDSDKPYIFQRFYRVEQSRSTPGHGLGLSLVAAIAQLHDMTISLKDALPGLVVELTIPAGENYKNL